MEVRTLIEELNKLIKKNPEVARMQICMEPPRYNSVDFFYIHERDKDKLILSHDIY